MPSKRPDPPSGYKSWIDWACSHVVEGPYQDRVSEPQATYCKQEYADLLAELEKLRAVAKAAEKVVIRCEALDRLCTVYRTGRRVPETTLDSLNATIDAVPEYRVALAAYKEAKK